METIKDKIYSLFNQAFEFAENTPSTEFQKYLEYSKDFATSFNRLIQEVKDPIEKNEIIDFCISQDDLLLIHLVAEGMPHPKEYALKRNYGALKELFLNRLELPDAQLEPGAKPDNDLKVDDFFKNLDPEQITRMQNEFSECRGIEMACFIHQMVEENNLEIIKNHTKKSFKNFLTAFAEIPTNGHEAVRKHFDTGSTKGGFQLINDNELKKYNIKERVKAALGVG